MKCSICKGLFGNGEYCQNCGVDKVAGLGNYTGYDAQSVDVVKNSKHNITSSPKTQFLPSAVGADVAHCVVPEYVICYHCTSAIPGESEFCPMCGINLYVRCPQCNNKFSSQYKFCNMCGLNLQKFIEDQEKKAEQKRLAEQRRLEKLRREELQKAEEARKMQEIKKQEQIEKELLERKQKEIAAKKAEWAAKMHAAKLKKQEEKREAEMALALKESIRRNKIEREKKRQIRLSQEYQDACNYVLNMVQEANREYQKKLSRFIIGRLVENACFNKDKSLFNSDIYIRENPIKNVSVRKIVKDCVAVLEGKRYPISEKGVPKLVLTICLNRC